MLLWASICNILLPCIHVLYVTLDGKFTGYFRDIYYPYIINLDRTQYGDLHGSTVANHSQRIVLEQRLTVLHFIDML